MSTGVGRERGNAPQLRLDVRPSIGIIDLSVVALTLPTASSPSCLTVRSRGSEQRPGRVEAEGASAAGRGTAGVL